MQKESNCFSCWIKKGLRPNSITRDGRKLWLRLLWGGAGNPHLEPCLCISPIFIWFNLVFGTVACFVSNAFKFLLLKFMSTKVIFLIVFPGASLWVFFCFLFLCWLRVLPGVDSNGKQANELLRATVIGNCFSLYLFVCGTFCCRNFLLRSCSPCLFVALCLPPTVFCNMCEAHQMQISVSVSEVEFRVLPHLNAVRESFRFVFVLILVYGANFWLNWKYVHFNLHFVPQMHFNCETNWKSINAFKRYIYVPVIHARQIATTTATVTTVKVAD